MSFTHPKVEKKAMKVKLLSLFGASVLKLLLLWSLAQKYAIYLMFWSLPIIHSNLKSCFEPKNGVCCSETFSLQPLKNSKLPTKVELRNMPQAICAMKDNAENAVDPKEGVRAARQKILESVV